MHVDQAQRSDTWLDGQEGSAKMSKSAELDASRINLLDSPKDVQNKIKRAKTDAGEGLEYDNPERPEARNLLTLYALATGHSLVSSQLPISHLCWNPDLQPDMYWAAGLLAVPLQPHSAIWQSRL